MVHATKPSVDLEGGERAPIARKASKLSIRTATRNAIAEEPSLSPRAPSPGYSPSNTVPSNRQSPLLDVPGATNNDASGGRYFSTLPPSPTTSFPPSPPMPSSSFPSQKYAQPAASGYPTPPVSHPGSARLGTQFDLGISGVTVLVNNDNDTSMSSDEGADEAGHANASSFPGRVKRRPSFIITTAPTSDDAQGLAIDFNAEQPLRSPRIGGRRSYPPERASTSPLPSPSLPPPSPFFSTSPVSSPTLNSFPNFLSTGSPILGSSSVENAPPSPRLSAFTDPLGRLATGLVRRASTNSLNAELPTSVSRSPSPGREAPSPTISVPSLSPTLGVGDWSGPVRRASFAGQAREKEKEKLVELKEREEKGKRAAYHNRMFSWAERPGDRGRPGAPASSKRLAPSWTRKAILAVFGIVAVIYLFSSPKPTTVPRPATTARRSLRRGPRGQSQHFIHPDVVDRRKIASPSIVGAPFVWLRNLVSSPSPVVTSQMVKPSSRGSQFDKTTKKKSKSWRPSLFKTAPRVAYTEHQALPPPPTHSDDPQRDTLVLYRILGNDLPPRHSPGQTLRNLRFLLQYESDFSLLPPLGPHHHHHSHAYGSGSAAKKMHTDTGGLRVDKYFVLNRIADPEMVSAIIGLLRLYEVPDSRILVIPFDWKEYQRRDFRWDGGVDVTPGWGIGHAPLDPDAVDQRWQPPAPGDVVDGVVITEEESKASRQRHVERRALARLRALDFTYHEKNLYAMNNNGGRNFALEHGRSLPNARWILPLDGNSFITPAAMYSITRTLSIVGEGPSASRYLVMPMARLLSNDDVRKNNSIALVPKNAGHEERSAIEDAEASYRPATAPETPEEPQVGFRYDSTESFQEAMRYGRRSKLELLWRLGAVPYSRALDRKTLPWEFADRHHITPDSWGSIPGAPDAHVNSPVHHSFDEEAFYGWHEPNPYRGPLAFVKAGWIYRLFSGHASQEQHSPQAITLRNANRIKGIIAFLEQLDDRIARGQEGCLEDENSLNCGYRADRLWNFDQNEVERLRQKYRLGRRDAVAKIDKYEALIQPNFRRTLAATRDKSFVLGFDPQVAATDITLLAMAGYLTGNSTYSVVASEMINARFVKQMPLFYRHNDHREQMRKYANVASDLVSEASTEAIVSEDGNAYVFPPPPLEPGETPNFNAEMGAKVSGSRVPPLPFNPLSFDPSFLLDAVRLLAHSNAPSHDSAALASSKAVTPMFMAHLNYLLYAPDAVAICRNPASPEVGAFYDVTVGALAAYLDDALLLGRVANRARLRLPGTIRSHEGLMDPATDVQEIHWRLVSGLKNVKFRPYSLTVAPMAERRHVGSLHGVETPLDVLGI